MITLVLILFPVLVMMADDLSRLSAKFIRLGRLERT